MESAVELITRLSQPSLRVFPEEVASCQTLAEVSKRFSFLQAQAFVHDHVDAPLLEVTMQDGTPLATRTSHTAQGPENIVVRRRGKKKGVTRSENLLGQHFGQEHGAVWRSQGNVL